MGFFKSDKVSTPQPAQTEAKEEKAVSKARLLGTEGGNKGAELNAKQSGSIRKVFGN